MLRSQNQWEYKLVPILSKGLNVDDNASVLNEEELTIAQNVVYEEGLLTSANGYSTFLGSVRGNPRRQIQYTDLSGTDHVVLITNDTVYEKNEDQWFYVSGGVQTSLTADASGTDTTITVDNTTGFSAEDFIGINLDDGTQHQTTVASVPSGTTINLDDALPSDASTASLVIKPPELGGIDDEYLDYVVMTSQDWLVFTNGVDAPKKFDGTTVEDVPNLPSSGAVVCKLLALADNYLCLIRTTEGGNSRPHRVRYSDKGDPTNWTSGSSGFTDLIDTKDLIIGVEPLGPYHIIYKESSIIRMQTIETSDLVFEFTQMVAGEGLIGPGAVAVKKDRHIFVGNANIYQYTGGPDLETIGDKLFRTYFSALSSVIRENSQRIFARYINILDEAWVSLVLTNEDYPRQVLRLDLSSAERRWTTRKLAHSITDVAIYSEREITSYLDLAGNSYLDLVGNLYTSFSQDAGSQNFVFTSPDGDGQLYRFRSTIATDGGSQMNVDVATRDFGNPHFRSRLNAIDILGRSSKDVNVQISIDNGVTWINIGSFNTSGNWDHQRFYYQTLFEFIRVRLTVQSDNAFAWKGFGMTFKMESPF